MADMLVKLYQLPEVAPLVAELKQKGIEIRQANPMEKSSIVEWVRHQLEPGWADEVEVAMNNRPITCYIATRKDPAKKPGPGPYDLPPEQLLGLACYDATRKGMFGPEGISPDYAGAGVGQALLLTALHAMYMEGYAYAVAGWVTKERDFYFDTIGTVAATFIEGSEPGIYRGKLIYEI
jgi:hypothetical protein